MHSNPTRQEYLDFLATLSQFHGRNAVCRKIMDFEPSCKLEGGINLEKNGDFYRWHPSCSYCGRYTAEAMVWLRSSIY